MHKIHKGHKKCEDYIDKHLLIRSSGTLSRQIFDQGKEERGRSYLSLLIAQFP